MTNMPHQIWCDYLEDKGIDTRLLRIEEPEVDLLVYSTVTRPDYEDRYGSYYSIVFPDGNGHGYGFGDGVSLYAKYEFLSRLQDREFLWELL